MSGGISHAPAIYLARPVQQKAITALTAWRKWPAFPLAVTRPKVVRGGLLSLMSTPAKKPLLTPPTTPWGGGRPGSAACPAGHPYRSEASPTAVRGTSMSWPWERRYTTWLAVSEMARRSEKACKDSQPRDQVR